MKKILLLLSISISFFAKGQYKDVFLSEYRDYFLTDSGKIIVYSNDRLQAYPLPEKIVTGAAGVHPASVIGESSQVYLLAFPGLTYTMPAISDGVQASSFWNTHTIVTKSGEIKVYDNNLNVTTLKNTGVKYIKVSAGYLLVAKDANSDLWFYDWKGNAAGGASVQGTIPINQIADISPVKIASGVTDFTCTRLFCVWIAGGELWQKTGNGPAQNMTIPYGITKKLIAVSANDNTIHGIAEDGTMHGVGDDEIGEVGSRPGLTYQPGTSQFQSLPFWIKTMQPIAPDRKFVKIIQGASYVYRTFALEDNGTWNSWGSNKGGLLANGILPPDNSEPGDKLVSAPLRVTIPEFLKRVDNAYLRSANYPPAEPVVIVANKRPVANAGRDTTMYEGTFTRTGYGYDSDGTIKSYYWEYVSDVEGGHAYTQTFSDVLTSGVHTFVLTVTDDKGATGEDEVIVTVLAPPAPKLFLTIHVYSDGTVSTAKTVNKKKVLITNVKVYTDGSIEK